VLWGRGREDIHGQDARDTGGSRERLIMGQDVVLQLWENGEAVDSWESTAFVSREGDGVQKHTLPGHYRV